MTQICPKCRVPLDFTGETRFTKQTEHKALCAQCQFEYWMVIPNNGPRTRLKFGKTWIIFCPACLCTHQLNERWVFTGTLQQPSFSPSLLVMYGGDEKCHSFIKHGKIEFCPDSSHKFAGQILDLPVIEDTMSISTLRRHDNYVHR